MFNPQSHEIFLKSIDELDLIRKINKFRNLNFQNMSDNDICKAISDVLLHYGMFLYMSNIRSYPANTKFYRVRELKDSLIPNGSLRILSDFWNKPADKVDNYGRLNKIGESLLYTAPINPFVAINEMKLKKNVFYALIIYKAKLDVKINVIGGNCDYSVHGITDKKAILIHEIYNNFLKDEFSRDVGVGTEYLYKISERIAKDYFDLPPREMQDAWAYSSVQDKSNYNVCFRPDIAKELLELQGAVIVKNVNPSKISSVAVAHGFDENGVTILHEIGSDIQKQFFPEIQQNLDGQEKNE